MRALRTIALGASLLVAVAALALVVWLPRYLAGDDVRAAVEKAAEETLGRSFRWGELEVGLLPPSLVVESPVVSGASAAAPPWLEARSMELRAAPMPLLAGVLVIDSLVLREPHLRLVRDRDGFELPGVGTGGAEGQAGGPEAEKEALGFALRRVELVDATFEFEDRLFSPPTRWDLQPIDLQARITSPDEPVQFKLDLRTPQGGRLEGDGTIGLDDEHPLELDLVFDEFPLEPFAPYVEAVADLSGRVSGTASLSGPAGDPHRVSADLQLSGGSLVIGEMVLRGHVALRAEITGGIEAPDGTFEADATDAELAVGEVYRKPAGKPARVKGRLLRRPDGALGFDDVHLEIQNLDASGRVELGERTIVAIDARPLDLAGWEPLRTEAAGARPSGSVHLEKLELRSGPLELYGRVWLREVAIDPGVTASGVLLGEGSAVRSRDLVLTDESGTHPVELAVEDLAGERRLSLRARVEGVESSRLLERFTKYEDLLYGPATLDLDLTGALAGEESFWRDVAGRIALTVAPGRLRGTSLLEATVRTLDPRQAWTWLKLPGLDRPQAPRLEGFYDDDFLSLSGTFRLANGTARTSDLRLVTSSYEARLTGSLGLEDLSLDAKGELVLGRDASGALVSGLGLPQLPVFAGIVIPLPAVRGTLSEPQTQADWSHVFRTLAANLPGLRAVDRLLGEVEGRVRGAVTP